MPLATIVDRPKFRLDGATSTGRHLFVVVTHQSISMYFSSFLLIEQLFFTRSRSEFFLNLKRWFHDWAGQPLPDYSVRIPLRYVPNLWWWFCWCFLWRCLDFACRLSTTIGIDSSESQCNFYFSRFATLETIRVWSSRKWSSSALFEHRSVRFEDALPRSLPRNSVP